MGSEGPWNESVAPALFVPTEALPTVFGSAMKYVLLPLCLIGIAVSAPAEHHLAPAPNFEIDGASSTAITREISPPPPRLQSTVPSAQVEIHAVVVDMPPVISLTYASPETWNTLPPSVRPFEQPAATPVLQFAERSN
jgi:hypothetical protein